MSNLRHCGIVVSDLKKMVRFYKLLGFSEVSNDDICGNFIDELIKINKINVKIIKLKSSNNDSIIELLKYKNLRNSKSKSELYEQGISHLAITVDNIDKTFEILKLHGAEFLTSPLLSPYGNVKVCFCKDIEGNWLEIVEEIKDKRKVVGLKSKVKNWVVNKIKNIKEKLKKWLTK